MENNIDQIRALIQKWYEGENSVKEEEMLRAFFLSSDTLDLPKDMKTAASIFRGEAGIRKENFPGIEKKSSHRFSYFSMIMALAASVALIFFIWGRKETFGFNYDGSKITEKSDAMASAEYMQYLDLLEDNLNMITYLK